MAPGITVPALGDIHGPILDIEAPSWADNRMLSRGWQRQSGAAFWQQCTWGTGEQWRKSQWFLYQAQSRTASHQGSPYCGRKSITPIPAASWFDLWAWDCDSCYRQGLHPFHCEALLPACWDLIAAKTAFTSCLTSSTHFAQQLSASQLWYQMGQHPSCISSCWALCGSDSWSHCEGTGNWRDLGELITRPLKFDIEQPSIALNPCLHLVFISELNPTSVIA